MTALPNDDRGPVTEAARWQAMTPEQRQAERARWGQVHLAGDRQPPLPAMFGLTARLGRYLGEGRRRERGAKSYEC